MMRLALGVKGKLDNFIPKIQAIEDEIRPFNVYCL